MGDKQVIRERNETVPHHDMGEQKQEVEGFKHRGKKAF
jgi:hypothetical protein